MGDNFKVRLIGSKKLSAQLKRYGAVAHAAVAAGLFAEGTRIMGDSKKLTPVITGNLRSSGTVFPPTLNARGNLEVELGYGGPAAPYAIRVHENPNAGVGSGVGQWKFLEQPFREHSQGMSGRIMNRVKTATKGQL